MSARASIFENVKGAAVVSSRSVKQKRKTPAVTALRALILGFAL